MSYAMKGYRGIGLIDTPAVTGQSVIDLDRSISTLLGDVNRVVAMASPDELPKYISFQANYTIFYTRWKAWFAKNQETWVTLAQKLTVPIIGVILSQNQDEEFFAFKGEYTGFYASWTQTLGQKTDAEPSGAAPTFPSWVWPVGATVLIIGVLGYFMSSFPVRFHVGRRS